MRFKQEMQAVTAPHIEVDKNMHIVETSWQLSAVNTIPIETKTDVYLFIISIFSNMSGSPNPFFQGVTCGLCIFPLGKKSVHSLISHAV
jgi:hypothetical protein